MGMIDEIIDEPVGGAHRSPEVVIQDFGNALEKALDELSPLSGNELRATRRKKFLEMGKIGMN